MAYQPESATYDAGVFQLETSTPALGGVGGAANAPLLNLANRTAYLKQHVDALEASIGNYAPLNSPSFTGSPNAPTAATGDRSQLIANTTFVQETVHDLTTVSVAGGANVNLTAAQAGTGMLKLTGAITANISVIVPNTAHKWYVTNATTGAFSVTLKTAAGTGVVLPQGKDTIAYCDGTNVASPDARKAEVAQTNTFTALQVFGAGVEEAYQALPASNIDVSVASVFNKTVTAAGVTFTVSNVPAAGTVASFILELVNGGAGSVTFWAGVTWAGGVVPAWTVSGRDVLGFITHDGGATWTGLVLARDAR